MGFGMIYYTATSSKRIVGLSLLRPRNVSLLSLHTSDTDTHQRDSKNADIGPNKMYCFKQALSVLVCKIVYSTCLVE